jgi:hypothetical protein
MTGSIVPRWSKLLPVVRVPADGATGSFDRDGAIERTHKLWLATHNLASLPPCGSTSADRLMETALDIYPIRSSSPSTDYATALPI